MRKSGDGVVVARRGGQNRDGDMADGEERAQGELHVLVWRERGRGEEGESVVR